MLVFPQPRPDIGDGTLDALKQHRHPVEIITCFSYNANLSAF
jgi:hypothetical protein